MALAQSAACLVDLFPALLEGIDAATIADAGAFNVYKSQLRVEALRCLFALKHVRIIDQHVKHTDDAQAKVMMIALVLCSGWYVTDAVPDVKEASKAVLGYRYRDPKRILPWIERARQLKAHMLALDDDAACVLRGAVMLEDSYRDRSRKKARPGDARCAPAAVGGDFVRLIVTLVALAQSGQRSSPNGHRIRGRRKGS